MSENISEPVFENEQGLDETAASSTATNETTAAAAAAPAEAQTTGTETTEDKGAEPSGAEKRIQQLVTQREQERKLREQEAARREELEREIEKLRQPVVQEQKETGLQLPVPPVAPEVDDFEDFAAYESAEKAYREKERLYIKDLAKHELLTELRQGQQQEAERRQAAEAQQKQTAAMESFQGKVNKAFEDDPELRYLPIFTDTAFPLPQSVYGEITISDTPVELLRYLNDNKEEAARLAALPPNQIARAIGRIEAGFAVSKPPQPKTVSTAPEPVQPIGGGGSGIVGDLSDEQFFAQEAAKFR